MTETLNNVNNRLGFSWLVMKKLHAALIIGHIRIPRISLSFKLVPVQYREYEYGLLLNQAANTRQSYIAKMLTLLTIGNLQVKVYCDIANF